MTRTCSTMLAALLLASCAGGGELPDNIPPAPPAWKGEVRAPSLEAEAEEPVSNDGFGTSAFDTAPTPTAPPIEAASEEEKEAENKEKAEAEGVEEAVEAVEAPAEEE